MSVRTQSLLTVALGGIAFASPIEGKGEAVSGLDDDALAALRREVFGFVFQGYHLIGTLGPPITRRLME